MVISSGPHTLGFLTGASGVGALVSAISLAVRKSMRGLTTMIQLAAAVFGLGLILFGFSHVLWLSILLMLTVGFGMMQGLAASNTVIQTLVPEDKRSRVMSYYTMAFVGMAPFGSLLAGGLAHYLGAPHTVMITVPAAWRGPYGLRWSCRRCARSCDRFTWRWVFFPERRSMRSRKALEVDAGA